MANNIYTDLASGGPVLATDEITDVHHQKVKVEFGVDGTATEVSSTNPLPVTNDAKIDDATNALVCIDYSHHEVHEGDLFTYHDTVTGMTNGATQYYMITTPDTTKWAHFGLKFEGQGLATIAVYEASDKTGTTLQTSFNKNRNSLTAATTTVHKAVSGGTTNGTQIYTATAGSGTNSNNLTIGKAGSSEEWILKQNTKYIILITNGTVTQTVNLELLWYEHTSLA